MQYGSDTTLDSSMCILLAFVSSMRLIRKYDLKCPRCGACKWRKRGKSAYKLRQTYECKSCGYRHTDVSM